MRMHTAAVAARLGPDAYAINVSGGAEVLTLAARLEASEDESWIWSQGASGAEIPLNLQRSGGVVEVNVRSISRGALLKGPQLH